MVIDVHAHIIVPEILREAAPDEAWRPRVSWHDGKQVIDFAGKPIRSAIREFVAIEQILQEQDKAGIDRVILAPWVSIVRYNAPADDSLRSSRIQNEAMSAIAQRYPERVSVMGTVPLQAPELAAREVQAIMRLPGMVGIEIAASVGADYLGHERFEDFWSAAEAAGAVIFIHPTTRGFDLPVLDTYYLWNTVGNPLETAITAAHMVMSGVMERHPNLKVILAHGGGALLLVRGRLQHAHTFQPQAQAKLKESPLESLRRFYYDTLTHDAELLKALIEFAGVDHVLLGSDYPFDMGDEHPAKLVQALGLDAATEAKILHENAKLLFGLEH
jgi:aminocarboxymuconate-semialdehyde decarboxylase